MSRTRTLGTRRRSAAVTFLSLTSFARPGPGTPAAAYAAGWTLIPFNNKAGLDSALSTITGTSSHVYIYYSGPGTVPNAASFAAGTFYSGSGTLTITTSTAAEAYTLSGKNPSGTCVLDFGTRISMWDASAPSSNYVIFSNTAIANRIAFWMRDCSNWNIFGGDFTTPLAGTGISIYGNTHDILWYDAYLHDIGASGIAIQAIDGSGAASVINNITIRVEVNKWCMNPSFDNHPDKGTGFHACILHGAVGKITNSTFIIYGHDSLAPGALVNGVAYPEGGGGSVIEVGQTPAGSLNSNDNITLYALGLNGNMTPNGTNPGSTAQQTGTNVINIWGGVPLNNCLIKWAQGTNMTGAVVHCASGNWQTASPPVTVLHGRHTNVNLYPGGSSNIAVPFDRRYTVVYNDVDA